MPHLGVVQACIVGAGSARSDDQIPARSRLHLPRHPEEPVLSGAAHDAEAVTAKYVISETQLDLGHRFALGRPHEVVPGTGAHAVVITHVGHHVVPTVR
jgi:hypothetical protein